jgi:DNA-binding NtrC family response regulator
MATLLLIGDNSTRSQALSEMLQSRLRHQVQLLPLASIHEPDTPKYQSAEVAILDISPSGHALLSEGIIALREHYPYTLVMVLYPFGDSETEGLVAEMGVDEMLARPVTLERLRLSLHNLSHSRQMRMMLRQRHGTAPYFAAAPQLPLMDSNGQIHSLHSLEAQIISHAVNYFQGRITQAARALGVGRSTLYRKIDELGLDIAAQRQNATDYISRANQTTRPMMRVSATGRS